MARLEETMSQILAQETSSTDHVRIEHGLPSNSAFLTLTFNKRVRDRLLKKVRELSGRLGASHRILGKKALFFWGRDGLCFYSHPELAPRGLFCKPGNFFQSNLRQNRALVEIVTSMVEKTGSRNIIEFFCGSGNLSIPIARKGFNIKAFEIDRKAVKSARRNANRNGCGDRAVFYEANLFKIGTTPPGNSRADTVVLDPPRAGAKRLCGIMKRISRASVIYVSCDPMTLKRDVKILEEQGFSLVSLQPIDMFPQTYHMETVALLVARNPLHTGGSKK